MGSQGKTKKYEQQFVDDFYDQLKKHKITLPATIIIKDSLGYKQVIRNVSGIRVLNDSVSKSPTKIKSEERGGTVTSKADIALYSVLPNGSKKDVAWISHKKDVKDHLQYEQMSTNVIYKTRKAEMKEIQEFKRKMLELSVPVMNENHCWPRYKDGNSLRIWGEIKSEVLMNMAIFGVEFGKDFGRNNVNVLMMGDPVLKVENNNIIFTTKESIMNGHAADISDLKPIFFTNPSKGSTTSIDGKKIKGVRLWIIRRTYATSHEKMDDVLKKKNELVARSCLTTQNEKKSSTAKPKATKSGVGKVQKERGGSSGAHIPPPKPLNNSVITSGRYIVKNKDGKISREEKIMYNPEKNIYYYITSTGRRQPITKNEIHKYISSEENERLRKGKMPRKSPK